MDGSRRMKTKKNQNTGRYILLHIIDLKINSESEQEQPFFLDMWVLHFIFFQPKFIFRFYLIFLARKNRINCNVDFLSRYYILLKKRKRERAVWVKTVTLCLHYAAKPKPLNLCNNSNTFFFSYWNACTSSFYNL